MPSIRDQLSSWKQETRQRLPGAVIWRRRFSRFSRNFLLPLSRFAWRVIILAIVLANLAWDLGSNPSYSPGMTALARSLAVIWLLGRTWVIAAGWLVQARFTPEARLRIALPGRSSEKWKPWWLAGSERCLGLSLFALECAVIACWVLYRHGSARPMEVIVMVGLTVLAAFGCIGWWLVLAAARKHFSLYFERPSYRGIGILAVFVGFVLVINAPVSTEIRDAAIEGWRGLAHVPLLGWTFGLLENVEPGDPIFLAEQKFAVLGFIAVGSILPWMLSPWVARRYARFCQRYWIALLAPHWPGGAVAAAIAQQAPSASRSGSSAMSPQSKAEAKTALAWPLRHPALPRWAVIDQIMLALLNDRERRCYDFVNRPGDPILTRVWIRSGLALLVAGVTVPMMAKLGNPDSPLYIFLLVVTQLSLLAYAAWTGLGGLRIRPWLNPIRQTVSEFPLFAGLPVGLRDLMVTDWKTTALRVAVTFPWFFGYLASLPLPDEPQLREVLLLLSLTIHLGITAIRPIHFPSQLDRRMPRSSPLRGVFWWRLIASIGLLVGVLAVLLGSFGLMVGFSGQIQFLPLSGIAYLIPAYAYWLIHWTIHNRADTTMELKPTV